MKKQNNWTHLPVPERLGRLSVARGLQNELLNVILDVIQDGVCILDRDLNVIYANVAMRHWYGDETDGSRSRKCYRRFHGRSSPCEDCPALEAIKSGVPKNSGKIYHKNSEVRGRQQVFCVPILDENGIPVLVVEYIRDITEEKRASGAAVLLQKQNDMLRVHLRMKEEDSKKTENLSARRMNFVVASMMDTLEQMLDEETYQQMKDHMEMLMNNISAEPTGLETLLTAQEIAVARYIMEDCVSKEIAEKLRISKKTVDFHRTNIRRKLKLGPNDNLKQGLMKFVYQNS